MVLWHYRWLIIVCAAANLVVLFSTFRYRRKFFRPIPPPRVPLRQYNVNLFDPNAFTWPCELPLGDECGCNNVTGCSYPIVPNIVHYVITDVGCSIEFAQAISLKSVLKYHKPDWVIIHTPVFCEQLRGVFLNNDTYFSKAERQKILHYTWEPHDDEDDEAVGFDVSGHRWKAFLRSDSTRLRVMMTYGGIYLDNDVYIRKPLTEFMRYEAAVWYSQTLWFSHNALTFGNQVLIGHKDARLWKAWMNGLRDWKSHKDVWYYMSTGMRDRLSQDRRLESLFHRVIDQYDLEGDSCPFMYGHDSDFFTYKYHAIHLMLRPVGRSWCTRNGLAIVPEINATSVPKGIAFHRLLVDLFGDIF